MLAEKFSHVEIIDVLKGFYFTGRMAPLRERLESHNSQPVVAIPNQLSVFYGNSHVAITGKQTVSTVLPPFSGKLRVDKKLKLSNEDFKQSVENFYENRQLSAIDQLKATPPYPTPHVLAQFASMAYSDPKHGDLQPSGFKETPTPLYNLETHGMDKTVKAFESETGQLLKDDKGKLKIKEVVDWPVSAGIKNGPELKDFLKWAELLKNYHPDIIDDVPNKVPKGYYPLSYHTTTYYECRKSLSNFTQDEGEFLEGYRWLRDMQKCSKPEDLFSVMSNVEAEREAEQKLQNLELDNESVLFPHAGTLHALIPCVKRLVRLFPHINDNTKAKLSSSQILKWVYQYETQSYVSKIHQSALDFNPSSLCLREFLNSGQKIWQLRMIGDTWTGIKKDYRVLQKTSCKPSYTSEGHYTILDSERLQTVNRMVNLNAQIPLLCSWRFRRTLAASKEP